MYTYMHNHDQMGLYYASFGSNRVQYLHVICIIIPNFISRYNQFICIVTCFYFVSHMLEVEKCWLNFTSEGHILIKFLSIIFILAVDNEFQRRIFIQHNFSTLPVNFTIWIKLTLISDLNDWEMFTLHWKNSNFYHLYEKTGAIYNLYK